MRPNNSLILNAVLANANQNSKVIWANDIVRASFQLAATGTAAGTIQIQASNDQATGTSAGQFIPTNWNNVGSPVTVNGAGSYIVPEIECSYEYLRLTYTDTSGGTFTVPVSGTYQVEAGILLTTSGTPTVGTTIADLQIIQAGSASTTYENKLYVPTTNTTIAAAGFPLTAGGLMYCLAGDTIKVQASVNLATAGAASSNTMNYFNVYRVGN